MKQPLNESFTATHRALAITEIQTIAFDLDWTHGTTTRSQSLLNLALTCHAFTDVALDYLWEIIDSPEKLFQVWHASGAIKPAEDTKDNGEHCAAFTWVRDPTPAEWHRFAYYSRRIRTMKAAEDDISDCFLGDFFDRFDQANSSRREHNGVVQDLFLRLESITWECLSAIDCGPEPDFALAALTATGCRVILGEAPRLRSLEAVGDADIWPSLLDAIAGDRDRPAFRRLAIRCNPTPVNPGIEQKPMTMERAAESLCRLMERYNIQTLKVSGWLLAIQDVQHAIFNHPTLVDLEIYEPWWDENGEGSLWIEGALVAEQCRSYVSPDPDAFPVLRSLRGELFDVGGLLGPFSFQNLESLEIQPIQCAPASWKLLRELLGAIGVCCSALLRFNVRTRVVQETEDSPSASPAAITRMQGCSRIYSFTLDLWWNEEGPVTAPDDFNPSDDDWFSIARAWPNLSTLAYACTGGEMYRHKRSAFFPAPRASIGILSSFGQYCRQLRKLDVPFYARSGTLSRLSGRRNRVRLLDEMEVTQAWIDHDPTTVKETANYLEQFVRGKRFKLKVPSCFNQAVLDSAPGWMTPGDIATPEEQLRCDTWKEVEKLLAT